VQSMNRSLAQIFMRISLSVHFKMWPIHTLLCAFIEHNVSLGTP
jgi:hypothetical protein